MTTVARGIPRRVLQGLPGSPPAPGAPQTHPGAGGSSGHDAVINQFINLLIHKPLSSDTQYQI